MSSPPRSTSYADHPKTKVAQMESIFNIRPVVEKGKLYRSARQDAASPDDIKKLRKLGIRTYLDFRNAIEYRNSLGGVKKVIDDAVRVVVPAIPDPKREPYPILSSVPIEGMNGKTIASDTSTGTNEPRRYLVDLVAHHVVKQIFNAAPLYKRLYSMVFYFIDVILGNHFKYFLRLFSDDISRHGLYGRYMDMLEHCGKPFCFILKALSDPKNLPAVISCAHGKDRTGVITALVLSILGKSDEYIAEDYNMSEDGLKPMWNELLDETVLKYKVDDCMAKASKETILKVLRTLRERYGSIENYLVSIGFSREDQDRLRSTLS